MAAIKPSLFKVSFFFYEKKKKNRNDSEIVYLKDE